MFDKEIALDSLKKIQTVIDTIIDRTSTIRTKQISNETCH